MCYQEGVVSTWCPEKNYKIFISRFLTLFREEGMLTKYFIHNIWHPKLTTNLMCLGMKQSLWLWSSLNGIVKTKYILGWVWYIVKTRFVSVSHPWLCHFLFVCLFVYLGTLKNFLIWWNFSFYICKIKGIFAYMWKWSSNSLMTIICLHITTKA